MSALLIIDQDPPNQRRYDAMLTDMGMDLMSAANADEAIAAVRSRDKLVEVVLVRWEFSESGGRTGAELISRMRQEQRRIPVIVISDNVTLKTVQAAKLLGAADFLMKPLDGERLRDAIWRVLRKDDEPELLEALRERVVGESPKLIDVLRKLAQFIPNPHVNILLIGESGTGKELLAEAIHQLGPCRGDLLARNVADFPEQLIESELFGHVKGAFTNAIVDRRGVFEEVAEGTLFLDEIGELLPHLQTKLLRVLETRTFRPVGGDTDRTFAGRLVCATNRNLAAEVSGGNFRPDLYYRLNACELHVPTLRERGDDLWLLVDHLTNRFAPDLNIRLVREVRVLLERYPFPGNIRELSNIIQHAIVRSNRSEITLNDLPLDVMHQQIDGDASTAEIHWPDRLFDMPHRDAMAIVEKDLNRHYLQHCHKMSGGNITQAANFARIDPKTFRAKWKAAGLPSLKRE